MIYKYVLQGETPSKKNNRITLKNGKTIISARYRKWEQTALLSLCMQKRPPIPLSVPLSISFVFSHNSLQRRDSDNGVSSLLDVLQDARILQDDNWKIVQEFCVSNLFTPKEEAKVEILITDY